MGSTLRQHFFLTQILMDKGESGPHPVPVSQAGLGQGQGKKRHRGAKFKVFSPKVMQV